MSLGYKAMGYSHRIEYDKFSERVGMNINSCYHANPETLSGLIKEMESREDISNIVVVEL